MSPAAKKKFDAFDAVAQFQLQILNQKPSLAQMKRDIQMNQLNIRPFIGDVFSLNMSNTQFIDALWSIIKLDEYADSMVRKLPRKEVSTFFQLITHFRQQFQDTLNHIDMRLPHVKAKNADQQVAIEIFRDRSRAKRRVH